VLLVIDHASGAGTSTAAVASLVGAVAFVSWRRLERGVPPVLAMAYAR
jgi:hypothetical protein